LAGVGQFSACDPYHPRNSAMPQSAAPSLTCSGACNATTCVCSGNLDCCVAGCSAAGRCLTRITALLERSERRRAARSAMADRHRATARPSECTPWRCLAGALAGRAAGAQRGLRFGRFVGLHERVRDAGRGDGSVEPVLQRREVSARFDMYVFERPA